MTTKTKEKTKEKKPKIQYSQSMPEDLLDLVDNLGDKNRWNRSTAVEYIVEEYFKRNKK